MNLSEQLSKLLQKYHLSQRGLAEKSGVNYVTINRIVNDYKFRATGDTIEKLARGLGCTEAEHDGMLRAAKRVPEEIEAKFAESTKAARLFRRISELSGEEVEDLLKELESRPQSNKK